MALQQIQELDPWLEEDEEVFFRSCKTTSPKPRPTESNTSLTAIVMTVAKFSFYFYLLFKVHGKLQLANSLIKAFTNLNKYLGGYSSATFAVLIFFIKRNLKKLA